MIVLALVAALQAAPPSLEYIEEAQALGAASFMAGFCVRSGVLQGDPDALKIQLRDLARRAAMERVDPDLVAYAVSTGSERQQEALEAVLDLGSDDGSISYRNREEQAVNYIGRRCSDLAMQYPATFDVAAD